MQEAFSVNAFQYIVKPIQESNFEQVFAQTIRDFSIRYHLNFNDKLFILI